MLNDPDGGLRIAMRDALDAFIALPTGQRKLALIELLDQYESHVYNLGFENPTEPGQEK